MKGLVGERGFDHANVFCSPDDQIATLPGGLARQTRVVAEATDLEPNRAFLGARVGRIISSL